MDGLVVAVQFTRFLDHDYFSVFLHSEMGGFGRDSMLLVFVKTVNFFVCQNARKLDGVQIGKH